MPPISFLESTCTKRMREARWAPPITSAEEASLIIATVWMPAVLTYDFPVRHKDSAQREVAKENRRKILLALGAMGIG